MATRVTPDCEQIPINVVGSSSFGRYPKINAEKTYNMFMSDEWLVDYPGYERALNALEGGIQGRGIFRSFRGNFVIEVIDSNVYKITKQPNIDNELVLTSVLIGRLETSSGRVYIDENLSQQICLVDGVYAYIYNYSISSPLVIQTDGALGTGDLIPIYVTYHNTFFLFGNGNRTTQGAAWYAYLGSGGTTIVEHDMLALQTKPDYALAIKRIPGQSANVLVLGGSVCEIHTQTGGISSNGALITYQRNSSFSSDYGCLAISTIAESDTHVCWLGVNESNSPSIMVFEGNSVSRISTDGIDNLLDSLHHPELSMGMMYRVDGHLFYHITFYFVEPGRPDLSDNLSLIYDFNTQKFFHITDQYMNFHPALDVIYFEQETYFLSLYGGALYRMSTDLTFINEDIPDGVYETDPNLRFEMQRIRIPKSIRFPTSTPFTANQFVMTLEQGCQEIEAIQECIVLMITEDGIRIFSENGGPGDAGVQLVPEGAGQEDCDATPYRPRVDLAVSRDGGETFGNYVSRWLNTAGHRKNILRWAKMGAANDLTLKLKFWSLGRFVNYDGILDVNP